VKRHIRNFAISTVLIVALALASAGIIYAQGPTYPDLAVDANETLFGAERLVRLRNFDGTKSSDALSLVVIYFFHQTFDGRFMTQFNGDDPGADVWVWLEGEDPWNEPHYMTYAYGLVGPYLSYRSRPLISVWSISTTRSFLFTGRVRLDREGDPVLLTGRFEFTADERQASARVRLKPWSIPPPPGP